MQERDHIVDAQPRLVSPIRKLEPSEISRTGDTPMLDSQIIASLVENVRGELVLPGDGGYDDARALYNAMIDKRPRRSLKRI